MTLMALAGCARTGQIAPLRHPQSDSQIQQTISELWHSQYDDSGRPPTIAVSDGVVSLTGTLDTPQARIDAVRDAWQPDGVTEVVNELQVAGGTVRQDRTITITLRTRLTFDTDVVSTSYSIETLNGIVYLMGVARDQAELDRVIKLAETTAGKGKVISYVRLKQDDSKAG